LSRGSSTGLGFGSNESSERLLGVRLSVEDSIWKRANNEARGESVGARDEEYEKVERETHLEEEEASTRSTTRELPRLDPSVDERGCEERPYPPILLRDLDRLVRSLARPTRELQGGLP